MGQSMLRRVQTCAIAFAAAFVGTAALSETPAQSDGKYWEDRERGWFWYQDPAQEVLESKPATPARPPRQQTAVPTPAAPTKAPELVAFAQLQKRVEEYRNIAIMVPSEANVRRYMEIEAYVMGKASLFADVAQRVAWATPNLDPTLQGRPVNAKALEVFEREQAGQRGGKIAELGADHVLFFFFRGDCKYCHAYAPTLAEFQAKRGIRVLAISVDGGTLPEFPDPKMDNGIASNLKVSQVPATFLAHPRSGKIVPIGFGVLSEGQLVERIVTVTNPASEALVPSVATTLPGQ